jgi:hypothetical protein
VRLCYKAGVDVTRRHEGVGSGGPKRHLENLHDAKFLETVFELAKGRICRFLETHANSGSIQIRIGKNQAVSTAETPPKRVTK